MSTTPGIDDEAVRLTLRERLLTIPGITEDNVAWENRSFEPPASGAVYFRERLIPVDERKVATDRVTLLGMVQYDVCVPLGSGSEVYGDFVKKIKQAFAAPQSLRGKTLVVIDKAPEAGPGRRLDLQSWVKSVTVHFRAYGPAAAEV